MRVNLLDWLSAIRFDQSMPSFLVFFFFGFFSFFFFFFVFININSRLHRFSPHHSISECPYLVNLCKYSRTGSCRRISENILQHLAVRYLLCACAYHSFLFSVLFCGSLNYILSLPLSHSLSLSLYIHLVLKRSCFRVATISRQEFSLVYIIGILLSSILHALYVICWSRYWSGCYRNPLTDRMVREGEGKREGKREIERLRDWEQ